jgi:hypothetical protein
MSNLALHPNAARCNRLRVLPIAMLVAVAVLALAPGAVGALTNYLANPGFESGTTGWTIVQPWVWNGPSYAVQNTNMLVNGSPTVHVAVHGGTNAFKGWGYFQTYATDPGAMQTFPASPGSTWTASGYASTQVPDNLQANANGSCLAYIRVLFLNSSMTYNPPLASYYSGAVNTSSPTSTWLYFQVTNSSGGTTLTAPAGTAFVRFQMVVWQPGPSAGVYAGGSCYWDDVTLFNTSKPDPEITVQPVPLDRVYGQTATFSIVASGLTTLNYNWQKDGADITDPQAYGIHSATLTLSNVTSAAIGNYTCTISDQAGPLTSDPAYLNVFDPGILSITPALGQTLTNGGTAAFSVAAAGSSTLTYEWQFNDAPLSNGPRIIGVTQSNLTIANLTAADAGTYKVLINGGAAQAFTGLKIVSPAQTVTNLLVNPGFEDGVFSEPWETAWTKFNGAALATTNDYYYLSATPVDVYAGNYVAEVYGSDADDGIYQGVPIMAGATYRAGGRFYMSSYAAIMGTVTVTLQVMFKDAGGNTLSTFTAPAITASFPADAWTYLQVTNATGGLDLVAPAGTVSATCQVYEFNWSYGGGTVYFDNLYVTPASLPPPAAVTVSASASGGMMNLSFPTTIGVIYELLYSGSLSSPSSWQTNSTVIGNGSVKTVNDPITGSARYYRVLEHY